jgi:hypothetical protein
MIRQKIWLTSTGVKYFAKDLVNSASVESEYNLHLNTKVNNRSTILSLIMLVSGATCFPFVFHSCVIILDIYKYQINKKINKSCFIFKFKFIF